jgi:hypothetical protein
MKAKMLKISLLLPGLFHVRGARLLLRRRRPYRDAVSASCAIATAKQFSK